MWLVWTSCPGCNETLWFGRQKYCPKCGHAKPGAWWFSRCLACRKWIDPAAKFCKKCGAPNNLRQDTPAFIDERNRWHREGDEFARRIETTDLHGLIKRGLVIEPGTQALLFQGGKLAATLNEGTVDLQLAQENIDAVHPATAIVMDAGELAFGMSYSGLRTLEDVKADAEITVSVRLADPVALYTNLMHGRDELSWGELADSLFRKTLTLDKAPQGHTLPFEHVIRARVKQTPVAELDGNLALQHALEEDLRGHIGDALLRNGLELVDVRFAALTSKEYEKVRDRRAETFLAGQQLDDGEQRVALNRRIRELLTKDQMNKFLAGPEGKEFEAFVRQTEHELGLKGIIRDDEMYELKKTIINRRGDADLARKHLLEQLDLEHQLSLIRGKREIRDEQLEHEVHTYKTKLAAKHEAEWDQFVLEKRKRDTSREETRQDDRDKIAKTADWLKVREQKDALKDKKQRSRAELDQEVKDRDASRVAKEREQLHEHEIVKIRTMAEPEQARLAADLKKTELFKSMTEDQILAAVAANSPAAAKAIEERFKAQAAAGANTEVRQLYEKMLALSEAGAERLERITGRDIGSLERLASGTSARQREHYDEMKGVAGDMTNRIADIATASVGSGSSGSAQIVCSECRHHNEMSAAFCEECGQKLEA